MMLIHKVNVNCFQEIHYDPCKIVYYISNALNTDEFDYYLLYFNLGPNMLELNSFIRELIGGANGGGSSFPNKKNR